MSLNIINNTNNTNILNNIKELLFCIDNSKINIKKNKKNDNLNYSLNLIENSNKKPTKDKFVNLLNKTKYIIHNEEYQELSSKIIEIDNISYIEYSNNLFKYSILFSFEDELNPIFEGFLYINKIYKIDL